jgi:hypothetical protein
MKFSIKFKLNHYQLVVSILNVNRAVAVFNIIVAILSLIIAVSSRRLHV